MKIAYIGGVKSGKSSLAEVKALELSSGMKPYYLATTEFFDDELAERINIHQKRRGESFQTVEEPLRLYDKIKECKGVVLIECLTMWMNNMLYHGRSEIEIMDEMYKICRLEDSMVFVMNEVGLGVIPENALARKFIDLSGKVSLILGQQCDELYFCLAGLSYKMKG